MGDTAAAGLPPPAADGSVTIYAVRHGETAWNADGTLQGQLDIPLNDTGREQAALLGAAFAALKAAGAGAPTLVVTSDLSRAKATAEAAAAPLGAPLIADARLRETNLGVWQGQTWHLVETERAAEVKRWHSDPDAAMEGGESTRNRLARAAAGMCSLAIRALMGGHAGALLVAHGGLLDEVGRVALRVPLGQRTGLKKHNCSVAVLRFVPSAETLATVQAVKAAGGDAAAQEAAWECYVASRLPAAGAMTPEAAADAVGAWSVVQWGIVDHLKPMRAGPRLGDRAGGNAGQEAGKGGAAAAPAGGAAGAATGAAAGALPGEEEGVTCNEDEMEAVAGGGNA